MQPFISEAFVKIIVKFLQSPNVLIVVYLKLLIVLCA